MPVYRSAGMIPYIKEGGEIKFLLIKSSNPKFGGWGFPKGHLDSGETGLDAAIRETQEETGLDIPNVDPDFKETIQYLVRYDYTTQPPTKLPKPAPKFVVYFLGESPSKNVRFKPNPETGITEHDEFAWLTFEGALDYLPHNKKLLKKANQHLLSKGMKLSEVLKSIKPRLRLNRP